MEQRALHDLGGDKAKPPPELKWVPRRDSGADVLVETPEWPMRKAVGRLLHKSVATPEERAAAEKDLDRVLHDEVFTGDQIGDVKVRTMNKQFVVYFELADDRKEAFADFTERNVGRGFAIIIDGR